MSDIVEKLVDLHKQATTERSHYYVAGCCGEAIAEITRLRAALAAERVWVAADPTAQTEPLTTGQRIVAWWETTTVSEPCELAQKIDRALASMKERCAKTAEAEKFSACDDIAAAIRALPEEDVT